MSTTRQAARRQSFRKVNGLGFNFTASGHSGGGFVTTQDPRVVQGGSEIEAERYHGAYLYQAANDVYRPAGDTTYATLTATIAHDGAAWASTATTDYEMHSIPSVELNEIYNEALRLLKNPFMVPLLHGPSDYDMVLSGHDDWDEASGSTSFGTQTTTSEVLATAKRSKVLLLGAAGEYTQAAALSRFAKGQTGTMFAMVKRDSGTGGIARILDVNSAALASVSFAQEEWLLARKDFRLDNTQEVIRPRMLGVANGDQIDVQWFGFVRHYDRLFNLPTWLGETATIKGVYRGFYDTPAYDPDTYLAGAVEYEALKHGVHYRRFHNPGSAHPHTIRIEKEFEHYLREPLFVEVEQPWSSPFGVSALFSTDSSETDCPANLLQAQFQLLLHERYPNRWPELKDIALPERAAWSLRFSNPEPEEDTGWGGVYPSLR